MTEFETFKRRALADPEVRAAYIAAKVRYTREAQAADEDDDE